MGASVSILRIEIRRSLAFWALPALAVFAAFLFMNELLVRDIFLWPDLSLMVRDLALLAGPFIGGAAAWMAGRDRRRGMEELLATTPRPATSRKLHGWAGTALWGVAAYAAVGGVILAYGLLQGAWGAPLLSPLLLGLLVVVACAAFGYAAGTHAPGRFTAPVVAVGLFGAQFYLSGRQSPLALLVPVNNDDVSIWYELRANLALPQAVLLIGWTAAYLADITLTARRSLVSWAVLASALILAVAASDAIIDRAPNLGNLAIHDPAAAQAAYKPALWKPVCSDAKVSVCLHPAFKPWLGKVTETVNELAAPLNGIPGAPRQARQIDYPFGYPMPDGTIGFDLSGRTQDLTYLPYMVAGSLSPNSVSVVQASVGSGLVREQEQAETAWDAQRVMQLWLLKEAGVKVDCVSRDNYEVWTYDTYFTGECRAVERFGKLSKVQQREWLMKNYAALREGKIGLEDLP